VTNTRLNHNSLVSKKKKKKVVTKGVIMKGVTCSDHHETKRASQRCEHYMTLHLKMGWTTLKTWWFGSAKSFWPSTFAVFWKNAQHSCVLVGEDCNKYDLTAAPCFWLANHNVGPDGFLLAGLQKSKYLNLDVRNIRTYWAPLGNGDALSYRWFTYVTKTSREYLHHWILLASLT
jgi:hypothetical protein